MSAFAPCLAYTLSEEGGWSDRPSDPGGATMRGITLATFRAWHDNDNLTKADLHAITTDDLTALYAARYYNPVRGPDLPAGLDLSVWDMGVNAGTGTSARLLQGVLGVAVDGWIGEETLDAVARIDAVRAVALAGKLSADAARVVQAAVGVAADGQVGNRTLKALTGHPHGATLVLCGALHDAQAGFYRTRAPALVLEYGRGWLLRCGRRLGAAVGLVGA